MPALETITLAKGGTAERTVRLVDLTIPDLRPLAVSHPHRRWARAIGRFYRDLCVVLFAARTDADYPPVIWIPDLWHARDGLSFDDAELMLDAWHTGHVLTQVLGYWPWYSDQRFLDAEGANGRNYYLAEERNEDQ